MMSGLSSLDSVAATSATFLTLDTPAQATPNAPITLTGTYQGSPQALDYNFGSGWIEASSPTFSNGVFSFTVPAGLAVGDYTPQIRDHYDPTIVDMAGTFVVDSWTPSTLSTSPGATAVFEFNANNPSSTVGGTGSAVTRVLNSLNPNEWLTAAVATDGNGIGIADNSGADGTRRLLQFHATKINASIYDPTTDWLDAGGVYGPAGSALVDLANSSDVGTSGDFTTIIALDLDKSYDYEAGPIWGSLAVPGPLEYAQIRYNGSNGFAGAEIFDSKENGAFAQDTISAGWHVMTMIKNDGTLTYRLDGQTVAITHITSTLSFSADDFMIGGGLPPITSASAGVENGVPPPYIGEFQAYSGVLAGSDLANAEKLAGNSIGLSLNPTVSGSPNKTPTAPTAPVNPVMVSDTTTGQNSTSAGATYTGPDVSLQKQYIDITTHSLNVTATTPNWFIYTGSGNDAIVVTSGTNVVDGATGSNFLTGGSGSDTFFVDARGAAADTWSSISNFHSGDGVTFWGVSASDFTLDWEDGQGAAGYTGLTLHAMAVGVPTASLTLVGMTSADVSNGTLALSFGTDAASGSPYLYVQAVA